MSYDLAAALYGAAVVPLALVGAVLAICLGGLWLAWCRRTDARLAAVEGRLTRLEGEDGR